MATRNKVHKKKESYFIQLEQQLVVANSLKELSFRFFRTTKTLEFTGKRASNLTELLAGIKLVDDLSIGYHMLSPLFKTHQAISNRTNDFGNWVEEILQEKELGEQLTAIDPYHLGSISSMRKQLELVIGDFLSRSQDLRQTRQGEEFLFHTTTCIVSPTRLVALNLSEFTRLLEQIDVSCIYHHFVEPRVGIRAPRGELDSPDDFSMWLAVNIGNDDIVNRLTELDPYLLTLEEIRHALLSILKQQISGGNQK